MAIMAIMGKPGSLQVVRLIAPRAAPEY